MLKKALILTAVLMGLGTAIFAQALFIFTPTTLPDAQYATSYPNQTVSVVLGGVPPYTYAITAGSLPAGMGLSADGTISGTPTLAGTYSFTITATDSDPLGPFTGSQNYTLVVDAVPLTITATSATMSYGGTFPSLGVTYTGFVNGDNPSSLTVQPAVTVPANANSPAGSYTITPSGASDPNYTISYVNGTLTINPVPLTITAANASMTYGGSLPTFTASYSGFVNSDNSSSLTTAPTVSTTATATSPAGTYPINASGAVDANYTITYVAGTLTIGKATLTVTADNKTMPYGGPLPPLTITYSGFVNSDGPSNLTPAPTATTTATASSPAGTYPITPGTGSSNNYTFVYVAGTLTVTQGSLTITANPASSVYGAPLAPNGSLTVTYSGFVNGDGPGNLNKMPTVTNAATPNAPVGTYTLTPSGAVDANYTIVYVNGVYSITKAALTITAGNQNMNYGAAVPNFTLNYQGFVAGDNANSLTTLPTITTTAGSPPAAGTYPITPSGAVDPNYTITYVAGTLTVQKVNLTIAASNASMTYGAPLPTLSVSYNGFVNGDNASSLTTPPTVSTTATSASPVGSYPVTATGAVDPNYNITYMPGTLMISKAALTVTADNLTMPLGGPLPTLTLSYTGFVNGDGPGNLSPAPTAMTTAQANSPAGTYPITPKGGGSPNYNFTYVNGTLSVGKAILTITANPASSVYGAALVAPGSLTVTYSGFVNGDGPANLTTLPTVTNAATAGAAAGNYSLTPSGAVDPNYTIVYVTGVYTIHQAALNIAATSQTITYGSTVPTLTATYTGFVNGDAASSLTTQPTITTTAASTPAAGTYPITASGAVDPNYTITYTAGTLTVQKAALTITANNLSMTYGGTFPTLGVTYTGFVNGETATNLTTKPTVSTTATAASPAGTYPITASGAVDPNYTISYVSGALTIGKATLTVTADNKTMSLGGPVPALTITYSGFANGDGPSSLSPQPTVTTTATASSPAGAYPITPAGGSSNNYTLIYVNGTLSVAKAFLTITANPASSVYGAALVPAGSLTVTYSGFVNGDGPANLTALPTVSNSAAAGSAAGNYTLTPSGAVDANYTIVYVTGVYTITPAALSVTATNQTMTYGSAVPALTATYNGFVNGDNSTNLSTQPIITTTATSTSPVGTYPITISGANDPNYTITYSAGILTVQPAPLTITANSATMSFGGALPALSVSYSGFVNGQTAANLTTKPTVTTTATASSPVGTYPITATGAVDPNYTITYVAGTLTIQTATLIITANSAAMIYGGTLPSFSVSYFGFINGDNVSSLTTLPTVTTTATASSPAGTYPITPSGAVDPNYNIVYDPGTLTINPAALQVAALAQTKLYSTPDPTFTYTVNGLVNGDNTGIFSGSLSRTPGESVGKYQIIKGTLSPGANYTMSFTGNYLTITKDTQDIAWTQSLLVGCNDTTDVILNATATSGLPVTYKVSDPKIATVSGNILTLLQPGTAIVTATQAGDSNYLAAETVTDTIRYESASLIRQHWNDVIFFDNTSGDYVAWQWYKNDSAVSGANGPYYSESPSLNGQYFVIATNTDGQQIQSCTLTIAAGAAIPGGIKVYPNPTTPSATVTVAINYPAALLKGAVLQVADYTGKVLQQVTNVQPSMQVTMPALNGIYIINLLLSNGQKISVNVLVEI